MPITFNNWNEYTGDVSGSLNWDTLTGYPMWIPFEAIRQAAFERMKAQLSRPESSYPAVIRTPIEVGRKIAVSDWNALKNTINDYMFNPLYTSGSYYTNFVPWLDGRSSLDGVNVLPEWTWASLKAFAGISDDLDMVIGENAGAAISRVAGALKNMLNQLYLLKRGQILVSMTGVIDRRSLGRDDQGNYYFATAEEAMASARARFAAGNFDTEYWSNSIAPYGGRYNLSYAYRYGGSYLAVVGAASAAGFSVARVVNSFDWGQAYKVYALAYGEDVAGGVITDPIPSPSIPVTSGVYSIMTTLAVPKNFTSPMAFAVKVGDETAPCPLDPIISGWPGTDWDRKLAGALTREYTPYLTTGETGIWVLDFKVTDGLKLIS